MQILIAFIGITVIVIIMLDIIWTTLGRHGGPLTDRISSLIWRAALRYHKYSPSHQLLSIVGLGIVLTTIIVWLFLLWIGWWLIFNVDTGAIISTQSGLPADIMDRLYFAGYSLWTLGIGDFSPQGSVWQIATVLASINGFSLITLSVSYLIPVVSATNEKRQLSAYISSLGMTPDEIILQVWNGKDCKILESHLTTLVPLLTRLEQQYPAYPVLHYFHATERDEATAPSIAVLDEALTIIEYGLKEECRLNRAILNPIRRTIWELLKTVRVDIVESISETPPIPSLDRLRSAGIPTVSDKDFRSAVDGIAERRKSLRGFVQNDGWDWYDVEQQ